MFCNSYPIEDSKLTATETWIQGESGSVQFQYVDHSNPFENCTVQELIYQEKKKKTQNPVSVCACMNPHPQDITTDFLSIGSFVYSTSWMALSHAFLPRGHQVVGYVPSLQAEFFPLQHREVHGRVRGDVSLVSGHRDTVSGSTDLILFYRSQ